MSSGLSGFTTWAAVLAAGNGASAATSAGAPPLGMWGVAATVFALTMVLAVLFRREDRRKLRVVFTLSLAWAFATIFWSIPFVSPGVRSWCALVSLVTLALAAVRVGWLLVIDWALAGGATIGMSPLSRDIAQAAIFIVTAIAAARAAGADAQSLATTGGLVTAGLTFSLQQTLGDLVAGVLLQARAPFRMGDWITYDSANAPIGRVTEINWRATKLVTAERLEIIVPNSVLAKAAITNFNEPMLPSRRGVYFSVSYETSPALVQRVVLEAIRGVTGVLDEPQPTCVLAEFHDSGVRYWVRYFITDYEGRDVIDGHVRVRLWYALKRAGIDFVFPRTELSLLDTSEPTRAARASAEQARRERALGAIDILAPLTAEERAEVARRARTERYAPGELVIREGDASSEFYVVAEGELAVLVDNGRREVARITAGRFFGEVALLTGEARTATVRVVRECVLYVIDKPTFQDLFDRHEHLFEQISRIVSERQEETARKRGEVDATGKARAIPQETILTRMRKFFGGD